MGELPLNRNVQLLQEVILDWALTNTRDFPWRKTTDPYKICAAEVMLHQTGANKVAPIYQKFVDRYPTLSKLSLAKIPALKRLLYPLGFLYRAERLKELANYAVRFFDGQMPSEPSDTPIRTVDETYLDKEMWDSNLLTAYHTLDESLGKRSHLQEGVEIIHHNPETSSYSSINNRTVVP